MSRESNSSFCERKRRSPLRSEEYSNGAANADCYDVDGHTHGFYGF